MYNKKKIGSSPFLASYCCDKSTRPKKHVTDSEISQSISGAVYLLDAFSSAYSPYCDMLECTVNHPQDCC